MSQHALFIPTNNGEEYFFIRWLTEQEARITAAHTPFSKIILYVAKRIDGGFQLKSHKDIKLKPTGIHPNLFYAQIGVSKKLLLLKEK